MCSDDSQQLRFCEALTDHFVHIRGCDIDLEYKINEVSRRYENLMAVKTFPTRCHCSHDILPSIRFIG